MVFAIGVRQPGGPDALTEVDLAAEPVGAGQVRIRVSVAAVSPTDTLVRTRARKEGDNRILVPGMDIAGVVSEIGADVGARLAVGEEVMAVVLPRGEHGAYRSDIVVPADSVVAIPAGLSAAQAATIPMNGLTAQLALDTLDLPAGAVLAVTGAAGTFGGYVVELAKLAGLTVVADSSPSDEPFVRACGADQVVARGDDFVAEVRRLYPDGVDAVVDGANLDAGAVPAVKDGGTVVTVRGWDGAGVEGVRVVPIWISEYIEARDKLEDLSRLAENGGLTVRVAGEFPAAQASEAHRRLEAGGSRGRFVLRFD